MVTKPIYFDGAIKANLNSLPEEAWRIIAGRDTTDGGPMALYKAVSFLYRCVEIRASALAGMPRDILRGSEPIDEQGDPIVKDLSQLLYQIETAICLYGYAYMFKQRNMVNDLGLRWLKPTSVDPVIDRFEGLTGFKRGIGGETINYEIDELVYIWQPIIDAEIGPGVPPSLSALFAAGVLDSTTKFGKQFFDRGAVFPMLLSVEGNPPQSEMEKLERWWQRIFKGVSDAWRTVAVRSSVKPEILSSPVSDMALPELTNIQRENIAVALGVPLSLVISNAANFATAQQDYFNFYDQTMISEADRIADQLNDQYLDALGMELKFQPARLEVMQQAQLNNADKVTMLFRDKVLTRNEARDIVGYEEIDDAEFESDIPEQFTANFDEPSPETLSQADDMAKWQKKALKAIKGGKSASVPFDSDYLDEPYLQAALGLCYTEQQVKNLFAEWGHIKVAIGNTSDEVDPERMVIEERFTPAIQEWLAGQVNRVSAASIGGDVPPGSFWTEENALLAAFLVPFVSEWVDAGLGNAAAAINAIGLGVDADVNARAAEWAGRHALRLARGLNDTTRNLARAKIRNWGTSGRPFDSLVNDLAQVISPRWRAELIASTEVTRAWAEATLEIAKETEGVNGVTWQTAADERVCPICGPLQGERIGLDGTFSNGMRGPNDSHPRCRCWLSLEA